MDIPIPAAIRNSENIYYKEIILKKEGSRIWTEYYAVLCDQYIVFNRKDPQSATFLENNCTILHLEPTAIVAYSRKTCYRFPFCIRIGKLIYHFKCETNLQRYRWVYALRLAIAKKSPEPPPKYIPTRYSRGKLAKEKDKLSLKAVKSAAKTNGQHSLHSARANGHINGHCARSGGHSESSDEENELQHSSSAIRFHKSKGSLLLTNKAAVNGEGESEGNEVFFISKTRETSFVADDLEIVDLDESDQFKVSSAENTYYRGTRDRSSSKASNSSQHKKKVFINDKPTDMEDFNGRTVTHSHEIVDGIDDMKVDDSGPSRIGTSYRIYPDNVKSHSWTSLGIVRKQQVTRRENSAPPATRRERIMNRKNVVEQACTKD